MQRFDLLILSFLQPASPASSIRRHVATRLGTATTTRLILSHSHSGTPNSSHAESRQLHYLDDSILEVFPQSKDTAKYGIMQGLQARGKKQEWSLEPCQPHPKKWPKTMDRAIVFDVPFAVCKPGAHQCGTLHHFHFSDIGVCLVTASAAPSHYEFFWVTQCWKQSFSKMLLFHTSKKLTG